MSLSKKHLSAHRVPIVFDVAAFGQALRDECPEVVFAFLLGSSKDGRIGVGSDLDVALYVRDATSLALVGRVLEIADRFAPGAHCDPGILNEAEPVYRFEALKGRLLFTRDQETYLDFYSLTCREYEGQLHDYARQRRYRLAVREEKTSWKAQPTA